VSTVPGVHGVIGLRVPGALAYRHLAIRVVTAACKMALEELAGSSVSGTDDFEAEVVSAFGEAFNNIAVHGFRGRTPEPVQIDVDWDDERLVITLVDSGRTFDPTAVAPPDLDELPEHGMGLFIIKSAMDEVDYRPGPPNVLRLIKRHVRREGILPGGGEGGSGALPRPPPGRAGEHAHPPGGEASPPAITGARGAAEALTQGDRTSGVEFIAPVGESCIVRTTGRRPEDRTAKSSRRR
jgi:serine/threonine-protein kinase RsbW